MSLCPKFVQEVDTTHCLSFPLCDACAPYSAVLSGVCMKHLKSPLPRVHRPGTRTAQEQPLGEPLLCQPPQDHSLSGRAPWLPHLLGATLGAFSPLGRAVSSLQRGPLTWTPGGDVYPKGSTAPPPPLIGRDSQPGASRCLEHGVARPWPPQRAASYSLGPRGQPRAPDPFSPRAETLSCLQPTPWNHRTGPLLSPLSSSCSHPAGSHGGGTIQGRSPGTQRPGHCLRPQAPARRSHPWISAKRNNPSPHRITRQRRGETEAHKSKLS